MTVHPFFQGVTLEAIDIRGVKATSPLLYPSLEMVAAVFTADLAAVRARMPTPAHRPWRVLPGRALVALHGFAYRECGIGPYDELAVTVAVDHGARRVSRPLRAALAWDFHGHVLDLPVTTEAALHGGIDYFGYPKRLAEVRFDDDATTRTCRLVEDGELVLSLRGPRVEAPMRRPREMTVHSFPVKDGTTLQALFRVQCDAGGQRLLPGDVELQLGRGPRAALLRSLDLGRPLAWVHVPRARGILYMPTPAGGA